MTRPLSEIEADLRDAEVRLQVSKAAFRAYLFGVMVGVAGGFSLVVLVWGIFVK